LDDTTLTRIRGAEVLTNERMKWLTAIPIALLGALAAPGTAHAATSDDAPTTVATTKTPEPVRDAPEEKDAEHLGIGAMAGVGFPRPLSVEALVRIERTVAFGVEYSALPKLTVAGVDARMWAIAADARVFPFRGAFFVGLRGGMQHASASSTLAVSQLSVTEQLDVDTLFINPRIGFLWGSAPGLTIGIEAGVQIPLSSSVTSSLPSQLLATRELTSVTDTLGKSALPTVDLLRIGFLF
jgi:hypothetical protein